MASMNALERQARFARVQRVARLLDSKFSIAGFRFGIDPLLGLFPGLGDAAAGCIALYIVWEAYQMGLPEQTLGRMLLRVVIDVFIGGIPVIGDLFDFFYKVNMRNMRTIERFMQANQ